MSSILNNTTFNRRICCFSINISNYIKIEEECENNRFHLIATCGLKQSHNFFANILNKCDKKVIKKVFTTTRSF